jgi:hypothetical protein
VIIVRKAMTDKECNNVVDIESEMLYYDVSRDEVTTLSLITYISGWRLMLLSRVAVSGDVVDFKFVSQPTSSIH